MSACAKCGKRIDQCVCRYKSKPKNLVEMKKDAQSVSYLEARVSDLEIALREALDGWDRCRQPNPYDDGDRARIEALRDILNRRRT